MNITVVNIMYMGNTSKCNKQLQKLKVTGTDIGRLCLF